MERNMIILNTRIVLVPWITLFRRAHNFPEEYMYTVVLMPFFMEKVRTRVNL